MSVSITDPRLARLFRLAEQRGLDYEVDPGFGEACWVDSFSNPESNYYVKIEGEEITCSCRASVEDIPCTHAAVAVAHFHPSIWLKWVADESAEFLKLRHKIAANAQLTLSERRKLARNMREVNESLQTEVAA